MAELIDVTKGHVKVWKLKFKPIHFLLLMVAVLYAASVAFVYWEGNDFWESVYWNLCSLSWSNCHAEIVYTPIVKLFSVVHGITTLMVIAVITWSLTGKFISMDWDVVRMQKKISKLKDHFIVCGYGRVGEHVCNVLEQNNVPFVVVEDKKELVEHVREKGILGIDGNALKTDVLQKASIGRARGLIGALGSDSDNLFLVLTAKELNPGLKVVATRAHAKNVVAKLHKVGADLVVLPEAVGGLELAREVLQLGGKSHAEKMISKNK